LRSGSTVANATMPAASAMVTAANWTTVATNGRRRQGAVGRCHRWPRWRWCPRRAERAEPDADDARPCRPHEQHNNDGDTEDDRARRHRRVVDTGRDLPDPDDRPDGDDHRQRIHLDSRRQRADGRTSRARGDVMQHNSIASGCACHPTNANNSAYVPADVVGYPRQAALIRTGRSRYDEALWQAAETHSKRSDEGRQLPRRRAPSAGSSRAIVRSGAVTRRALITATPERTSRRSVTPLRPLLQTGDTGNDHAPDRRCPIHL
jgi:hypothetical protein